MPSDKKRVGQLSDEQVTFLKHQKRIIQRKIKNLHTQLQNYKSEFAKLKNYSNEKWRELLADKRRFLAVKKALEIDRTEMIARNRKFEKIMKRRRHL